MYSMPRLINENSVMQRVNVPVTRFDSGLLAIDRSAGYCYSMNATTTRVWDLLAEPQPVSFLCEALCKDFQVEDATCLAEVVSLLTDMERAGLVH
jgi:hypothetical protein